jgi:hypothetical protein
MYVGSDASPDNSIGDVGAEALVAVLRANTTLTRLVLERMPTKHFSSLVCRFVDADGRVDNAVSTIGAQALAAALKDNRTLRTLSLGCMFIHCCICCCCSC